MYIVFSFLGLPSFTLAGSMQGLVAKVKDIVANGLDWLACREPLLAV